MDKLTPNERLIMLYINSNIKQEFTIKEISKALAIHIHNVRTYVYNLQTKKQLGLIKFGKEITIVKNG